MALAIITRAGLGLEAPEVLVEVYLSNGLPGRELEADCALTSGARAWLTEVLTRLKLSARAYYRVLRLALTLADMAGEARPGRAQLMEAIGYR